MTTITEQLGRVLAGRYRLDAGLGTGASAYVYAAFDTRLGRRVAVKLLHPGLSRDERFLRRLRAEAQAVAALNHPNLLKVFDWGEGDDGPFLVLELLTGGSLQDLLDAGGRLDIAQAANVGAQAARGLAYAHRRGFVHRDVKPGNLLFDEDGGLRVADFGLARALAEAAWTEPSGAVLGTARYASPEQAEGRTLDDRSDVYSLALVLYEAVVGRVPFAADTTLATLMARIGAPLPASTELGPLGSILGQAAISEPLARLDAGELADNLELLARQLPRPRPLPLAGEVAALEQAADQRPTGVVPAVGAPPTARLYDGEAELGRDAAGLANGGGTLYDGEADLGADVAANRRPRRGRRAVADPGAQAEPRQASEPRGRRSRRRSRRTLVVAALATVVLVVAGGAAATLRFVVYGHAVPQLQGLGLRSARTDVAHEGLRLDVSAQRYSAMPPGAVLSQSPRAGRLERSGVVVHVVVSKGRAPVTVPAVVGQGGAAAVRVLRAAHLTPRAANSYSETVAPGKVISADPSTGSAAYGSTVSIVVSKGPAPRTIPSGLAGSSWEGARSGLRALRLDPVEQLAYSSTVAAGEVVSTSPPSGTSGVAVGTRVDVVVSRGPRLVAVPTVQGQAIGAAIAELQQHGLDVTEQVGPPNSTYATATDPLAGAEVAPGTDVTIYVA